MPEQPAVPVRVRRVSGELRELRQRHGLAGGDVAQALGISVSKLSRMENGMAGKNSSGLCRRKSSRSGQRLCVEVAFADQAVLTRDSKHRDGAVLEFSAPDWSAFLGALRTDRFAG